MIYLEKNLCRFLIILSILGILLCVLLESVDQPKEPKLSQKEAEPLVIETSKWEPYGIFNGTIVINGEGIQESGYEGIMYIEMDGDKIRISCTEAVRSRFGEWF